MSRRDKMREIEEALWLNGLPFDGPLVRHIYERYHAPSVAGEYTEQDVWEQTRKIARFYARTGRLPEGPSEWAPGWGDD